MKEARDGLIVIDVPEDPNEMREIADAIGGPVDYGKRYLVFDWDKDISEALAKLDADVHFFEPTSAEES